MILAPWGSWEVEDRGPNAWVISLVSERLSYLQLDWYSWIPNGPCTMQKPPPISKDVTEKDIVDSLPSLHQARTQKTFIKFLGRCQPVMVRDGCLHPRGEGAVFLAEGSMG